MASALFMSLLTMSLLTTPLIAGCGSTQQTGPITPNYRVLDATVDLALPGIRARAQALNPQTADPMPDAPMRLRLTRHDQTDAPAAFAKNILPVDPNGNVAFTLDPNLARAQTLAPGYYRVAVVEAPSASKLLRLSDLERDQMVHKAQLANEQRTGPDAGRTDMSVRWLAPHGDALREPITAKAGGELVLLLEARNHGPDRCYRLVAQVGLEGVGSRLRDRPWPHATPWLPGGFRVAFGSLEPGETRQRRVALNIPDNAAGGEITLVTEWTELHQRGPRMSRETVARVQPKP